MSTTALHETIGKQGLIQRAASLSSAGAQTVEALGRHAARYGLVLALFWIGGMKFTAYEAEGISGFVSNSPLMSWAYSVFSIRSFSALLGVTEIAIALLIASRPFSARAALVGSGLAVGMFLTTLSFLLTTPGRVGGIGWRIPGAVRGPRTVPRQRLCVVRRIPAAVWRRLARPDNQLISGTTIQVTTTRKSNSKRRLP